MEYQLCKEIGRKAFRAQRRRGYFCPVPDGNRADRTYRRTHPADTLPDAYLAAAGKGKSATCRRRQKAFSGISGAADSVRPLKNHLCVKGRLYKQNKVQYLKMFENSKSRSELVAIFLALLELINPAKYRSGGEGKTSTCASRGRQKEQASRSRAHPKLKGG